MQPFARSIAAIGLPLLIAGAISAPATADVCVTATPGIVLGCDQTPASTAAAAAQGQSAPSEGSELVRMSTTTPQFDPHRINVTFRARTTHKQALAALARAGVSPELSIPVLHVFLGRVAPSRIERALALLRSMKDVIAAGPEPLAQALDATPNDAAWQEQTGLRLIGFPRAWEITRGAASTIVAVVDTGVDPRQADLRGALVPGYDFVNGTATPNDDHGHGTAVAGIIAARADNATGVAGVCWRCMVMPIKVLDARGVGDDTRIAAGVVWAVDHGAGIVNLSLGGTAPSPQLAAALAYAAQRNVIVVAAAGNSGSTTQFYPAADSNALSVAATTIGDEPYSWTNFGAWVDVAAPGCNVSLLRGAGIGNFCGTSSAAPLVTGVAALARSEAPTASALAVEQAIEGTAVPLGSLVHYGRIDARGALLRLASAPREVTAHYAGSVGPLRRRQTFTLGIGAGTLALRCTFSYRRQLTVRVVSHGKMLATATGRGIVRIERQLPAGTIAITVSGSRSRTPFTLTATHAPPEQRK